GRSSQGLLQAALVVAAVLNARMALFDVLRAALDGRPPEAVVLGTLLLAAMLGCVPIAARQFPNAASAKRALALGASAGALLLLLRPPLPAQGGWLCPRLPFGLCPRLWDEAHMPGAEEDDVAIYGEALARRKHWPLWMLLGAVLAGLSAATSSAGRGGGRSLAGRLGYAAASGACVGAYLALEFSPDEPVLQVLVMGMTLLVAGFLVLLQLPGGVAPSLPWAAALWAALLAATLGIQAGAALPPLPAEAERLFPDAADAVEADRRDGQRAALMAVGAAQALLLAFALKLRATAAASAAGGRRIPARPALQVGSAYAERASGFLGACLPRGGAFGATPPGGAAAYGGLAGGGTLQRLEAEGLAWVPAWGNACAGLCFALCLVLNEKLAQGADAAILVLAPVLLLLGQDRLLCSGLSVRRRYFPPAIACVTFLCLKAVAALWAIAWPGPDEVEAGDLEAPPSRAFLARNAALLALALPNLGHLLRYLWSGRRAGGFALLLLTPPALVAAVASDLAAVQLLGVLAAAAAGAQFAAQRYLRQQGMKLV
ncbi:hypothetical protein WJX81_008185, partial [Elliptochloris bilobata]